MVATLSREDKNKDFNSQKFNFKDSKRFWGAKQIKSLNICNNFLPTETKNFMFEENQQCRREGVNNGVHILL